MTRAVELNGLNRIQSSEKTGDAKTSSALQTTVDKLIENLGVPADLLGEPEMTPDIRTQILAMVVGLSAEDRKSLATMAAAKKLSDYNTRQRILPRNYERVLEQTLKQI
jgi:hypothetical protein